MLVQDELGGKAEALINIDPSSRLLSNSLPVPRDAASAQNFERSLPWTAGTLPPIHRTKPEFTTLTAPEP
jgi:hypothetical protein